MERNRIEELKKILETYLDETLGMEYEDEEIQECQNQKAEWIKDNLDYLKNL